MADRWSTLISFISDITYPFFRRTTLSHLSVFRFTILSSLQMESINDLKEMTSYKGYTLRHPIYTSRSTQQIYDYDKELEKDVPRYRYFDEHHQPF